MPRYSVYVTSTYDVRIDIDADSLEDVEQWVAENQDNAFEEFSPSPTYEFEVEITELARKPTYKADVILND